jgi:hypothetical protein
MYAKEMARRDTCWSVEPALPAAGVVSLHCNEVQVALRGVLRVEVVHRSYPSAYHFRDPTRMTFKSITLVPVGPVTSRSPSASNNG